MAEFAYLRIGDPVMNANARFLFMDVIALKVGILTHILCDQYTVTYQAASLVTVFDLISLTQPHGNTISPFWHIIPQPVPKPTHNTDDRISVLNSLLTHFHPIV